MLKVVLATPMNGRTGGIARWAHHVKEYYDNHHKEEVNLSFLPIDRGNDELTQGKMRRILCGIRTYILYVFKELQMLIKIRPQTFHIVSSASYGLYKDIVMLTVARLFGCKTILHFRFGRIPDLSISNNWEWKLLKFVVKKSNIVVVLDERSCRTLHIHGIDNVMIIPNPISSFVFEYAQKHIVKREENLVLFVGHCYKEKGVFELAKACLSIPDIRLVYAGTVSDEIKESILTMIDNKIDVCFTGNIHYETVLDYMLKCSVLVLPSYTEGFPNVILEGMACSCPIIATDVGAIPEMLTGEDLNCGEIVKPKDVEQLYEALCKMLFNSEYANLCGKNAKERVYNCYSMDYVWDKMMNIWRV